MSKLLMEPGGKNQKVTLRVLKGKGHGLNKLAWKFK